eukprot:364163-Chlamydomonas_euryale.AAC.22
MQQRGVPLPRSQAGGAGRVAASANAGRGGAGQRSRDPALTRTGPEPAPGTRAPIGTPARTATPNPPGGRSPSAPPLPRKNSNNRACSSIPSQPDSAFGECRLGLT